MLPHDLPPHIMVYGYFQKWQRKGIWQEIHDQLRHALIYGSFIRLMTRRLAA